MEGEDCGRGRNREASSVGSGTESRDEKSESSGKGAEMGTSEADNTDKRSNDSGREGDGRKISPIVRGIQSKEPLRGMGLDIPLAD